MKERVKVATGSNEVQWLYSPDWEYVDYGNCKRYLQIIFPYKREMYNDIPQYATLAKRGYVVAVMQ